MYEITKQWRITKYSALIILLFAFFIINCILPEYSSALIGIKEGDLPKQVILDDLKGTKVDVTKFFGSKPVILIFWKLTTNKEFLDYSMDELILLKNFHEQYHNKAGLEIFAIYTPEEDKDIPDTEIAMVQNMIKANKIPFPILIDRGFKIFKEYGVIALPSTIMIDKTGKIRFIYPSFPIAAQSLIAEQIMDLIGLAKVVREDEGVKTKRLDTTSNRFYQYALQMYKKGLLEQAASPLKKSIDIKPDYSWAHNLMGIIFSKRGNFEKSAEEFKFAIKLDKNNVPAHFNYGLLLFNSEKYNEAEQYFKTSITLNNAMAEAHYVLGLLYKKTKRHDEALNELKTALVLFEKKKTASIYEPFTFHRISVLYALADLYALQGDDKKAFALLQQAVQITLGIEGKPEHLHRSEELMMYE